MAIELLPTGEGLELAKDWSEPLSEQALERTPAVRRLVRGDLLDGNTVDRRPAGTAAIDSPDHRHSAWPLPPHMSLLAWSLTRPWPPRSLHREMLAQFSCCTAPSGPARTRPGVADIHQIRDQIQVHTTLPCMLRRP